MEELLDAIDSALSEVHMLERTVTDFKGRNQMILYERINNLVKELGRIQAAGLTQDAQIPIQVVRCVDEGQNPDHFTRDFLVSCLEGNEATRGKVLAFKSLRKHLLEEIDTNFPDEGEAYRNMRSASKQGQQAASPLANGIAKDKLKLEEGNGEAYSSVEASTKGLPKTEPNVLI